MFIRQYMLIYRWLYTSVFTWHKTWLCGSIVHIIHETDYVTSQNIYNYTGNYIVNYNSNYAVLSVALYNGGIDQILPSKF